MDTELGIAFRYPCDWTLKTPEEDYPKLNTFPQGLFVVLQKNERIYIPNKIYLAKINLPEELSLNPPIFQEWFANLYNDIFSHELPKVFDSRITVAQKEAWEFLLTLNGWQFSWIFVFHHAYMFILIGKTFNRSENRADVKDESFETVVNSFKIQIEPRVVVEVPETWEDLKHEFIKLINKVHNGRVSTCPFCHQTYYQELLVRSEGCSGVTCPRCGRWISFYGSENQIKQHNIIEPLFSNERDWVSRKTDRVKIELRPEFRLENLNRPLFPAKPKKWYEFWK